MSATHVGRQGVNASVERGEIRPFPFEAARQLLVSLIEPNRLLTNSILCLRQHLFGSDDLFTDHRDPGTCRKEPQKGVLLFQTQGIDLRTQSIERAHRGTGGGFCDYGPGEFLKALFEGQTCRFRGGSACASFIDVALDLSNPIQEDRPLIFKGRNAGDVLQFADLLLD